MTKKALNFSVVFDRDYQTEFLVGYFVFTLWVVEPTDSNYAWCVEMIGLGKLSVEQNFQSISQLYHSVWTKQYLNRAFYTQPGCIFTYVYELLKI